MQIFLQGKLLANAQLLTVFLRAYESNFLLIVLSSNWLVGKQIDRTESIKNLHMTN